MMFSKNFKSDHKFDVTSHNALIFDTSKSKEETIDKLMKMGIKEFLKPDILNAGYSNPYKDSRINGAISQISFSGCCAFTQAPARWYLFPIHKNELKNVGMTEETLLYWLKFLNDLGLGLDFLYLGEQNSGYNWATGGSSHQRITDNTYYWVAVPAFKNAKTNYISYYHWILLRYCFDTQTAGTNFGVSYLPYYMIPRITDYFYNNFKLTRVKALLYAHVTSGYFYNHSLFFSEQMGVQLQNREKDEKRLNDYKMQYPAPCLNVTTKQYKELIWKGGTAVNHMLAFTNFDKLKKAGKIPEGLKNLDAPYAKTYKDIVDLHTLFKQGKYKEFIETIQNSYPKKASNKEYDLKTVRKTLRNAKRFAHS